MTLNQATADALDENPTAVEDQAGDAIRQLPTVRAEQPALLIQRAHCPHECRQHAVGDAR
jgi:hypothetical protein